jgi:hypothetical protein
MSGNPPAHDRIGLQQGFRVLNRTLPTGHRTTRLSEAHRSAWQPAKPSVFANPAFGAGH